MEVTVQQEIKGNCLYMEVKEKVAKILFTGTFELENQYYPNSTKSTLLGFFEVNYNMFWWGNFKICSWHLLQVVVCI